MKCIHCKTDSTYPERRKNRGRCKGCKHPFAFEPKPDPLSVTDGMMQAAVAAVSDEGRTAFTERNLWYELNRRLLRRGFWRGSWGALAGMSGCGSLMMAFVLFMIAVSSRSPWLLVATVALVGAGLLVAAYAFVQNMRERRRGPGQPKLDINAFRRRYMEKWTQTHGAVAGLLPPERALSSERPPVEPDVADYSFDRAVITDHADVAAMLLANNFHFENNCAVLSVDGYPRDVFATVMTMLHRNPNLTVFAVHDATPRGCLLPLTLREDDWFPDTSVRVVDLGLRPRHAEQLRLIRLHGPPHPLSDRQRQALTDDEAAWFATGETAELAALRPIRLLRAMFQGFAIANRPGDGGADGGGFFIWGSGDSAEIYAADSFG